MFSRKRIILLASVLSLSFVLAAIGAVMVYQRHAAAEAPAGVIVTESAGWFCPMHPQVVSDHAGSCPICGMHLVQREAGPGATDSHTQGDLHSHDPSQGDAHSPAHEEHGLLEGAEASAEHDHGAQTQPSHSQKEHEHSGGDAQPEGRDAVEEREPAVDRQHSPSGQHEASAAVDAVAIHVAAQVQRRMGLLIDTIEPVQFQPSVSVAAQAIADAQRAVSVSPRVEGWIERLGVSVVGQPVRKGDMLFEIYSPELQQRQRDYIDLLNRRDSLLAAKGGGGMGAAVGNTAPNLMLASVARERFRARDRLLAADVPAAILEDLEKFRRVHDVVPVLADYDGVVTSIDTAEGTYVSPAKTVVSYADPRATWAELSLNPQLLSQFGHAGEMTLRSTVDGTTQVVAPMDGSLAVVDAASRTARVRVPLPDAGNRFLAGTLLEAEIRMAARTALIVNSDAVIRTGQGDFLMVAGEADHFRQVPVRLGAESGDQVEVLSGLAPGARVVTNGQFLLSAESSLQATRQRIAGARSIEAREDRVVVADAPHAGQDHLGH